VNAQNEFRENFVDATEELPDNAIWGADVATIRWFWRFSAFFHWETDDEQCGKFGLD